MTPLAQDILAALPQTQCTRCGYPDCAAYAQAVANNEADINQCPPGGQEGVARLAADRPDSQAAEPGAWCGRPTQHGVHRRRLVYWLHPVYQGLPGGRDCGRQQINALR